MKRVYIVGAGGAGKTTLAHRLARYLRVPVYQLDRVCYADGIGGINAVPRKYEERIADVARIAGQPEWIAEGIYLWWTRELLRAADTVVWLDLPYRVAAWRIMVRHIRRSLRGRNPYRGLRKLLAFLLWVRRYYRYDHLDAAIPPFEDISASRIATEHELAPFVDKVVHLRSQRDVKAFLARVKSSSDIRRM